MRTKRCSTCGETKPLDAFTRWRDRERYSKDCFACMEIGREIAKVAERERARERAREWHHANRDRARRTARSHYEANAEERKARARAWSEANPERKQANDKRWREKNHEAVLAYQRQYRERTNGNPEINARRAARTRAWRATFRATMFERDQGICGICGQPVSRDAFHIDHVVPVSLGGEHSVENMQIAHPYCNRSKGNRVAALARTITPHS